jgi:hypothetical protein
MTTSSADWLSELTSHRGPLLILAALDGPDAIARYLAGTGTPPAPTKRTRKAARTASATAAPTVELSRASHHHVYDLAWTCEELQAWRETVLEAVDRTGRAWR